MLTETSTKVALLVLSAVTDPSPICLQLLGLPHPLAGHGQQRDDLLLSLCWKVLTCSFACRSASDAVTPLFSGSGVLLAPHEPRCLPAAQTLQPAPCQPVT